MAGPHIREPRGHVVRVHFTLTLSPSIATLRHGIVRLAGCYRRRCRCFGSPAQWVRAAYATQHITCRAI